MFTLLTPEKDPAICRKANEEERTAVVDYYILSSSLAFALCFSSVPKLSGLSANQSSL